MFYSGSAEYLSVDTTDGRVGFLRGAIPQIAVLSRGRIEITNGDVKTVLYNADGMLKVGSDGVDIIASACADNADALGMTDDEFAARDEREDHDLRMVKARIVTSIRKLRDKADGE